jgi:hypothetical protein
MQSSMKISSLLCAQAVRRISIFLSLPCAPRSLRSTSAIQRPYGPPSTPVNHPRRAGALESTSTTAAWPLRQAPPTPVTSSMARQRSIRHGGARFASSYTSSPAPASPSALPLTRYYLTAGHPIPGPPRTAIPSMEIWALVKQMKARRRRCDWLINPGELLVGSSVVGSGHCCTPAPPPRLSSPSPFCSASSSTPTPPLAQVYLCCPLPLS